MSIKINLNIPKLKPLSFLFWVAIGAIVVIGIFFGFFIYNMLGQTTSNDIAQWGQFGDFFGGILNPIISLASLIILAYLTVMISKNDNEESLKQFYLERKIEAYGELMNYYTKIKFLEKDLFVQIEIICGLLKHNLLIESEENTIQDSKINLINQIKIFIEFKTYISLFSTRYIHIFKYDFSKLEFKDLLEYTKKIAICLELNEMVLNKKDPNWNGLIYNEEFQKEFYIKLEKFVNDLKNEVDHKKIS